MNTTLDRQPSTFPLNQTLYFDFTHDTNIASVLTALGLTQFAERLPATGPPPDQKLIISHLTPFAARLVVEVIWAPHPVRPRRPAAYDTSAGPTRYVHVLLNQRTIPLHRSHAACEPRDDGWCEFGAFMRVLDGLLDRAKFWYSCFGEYSPPPYGSVTDGVPPPPGKGSGQWVLGP